MIGESKKKPDLPVFFGIGVLVRCRCRRLTVGWSIRGVCVAIAEVKVDVVIIILVFLGTVHVRVLARGWLCSMMTAALVVLRLAWGGSRLSPGRDRLWGGSGWGGRFVVVAGQAISDGIQGKSD